MSKNEHQFPLCIDCDGTLLRTDLLHEAVFLLAKQYPQGLFLLPIWLLRGKVYLKERLAQHVSFDWSTLPYHEDVLALIAEAREHGRKIVLATASPRAWADGIAEYLGIFDDVIATENGMNLSGVNKAQQLVSLHGDKGFDYAGNGRSDIPVWKRARRAVVVSSSASLIASGHALADVSHVFPSKQAGPMTYLRALRVHQWLKNLLVWVPLFAAHKAGSLEGMLDAGLAFVAFSLCASAVYVLNDLLDLESDRQHVRKRKRPFASAHIPLWQGTLMVPLLLCLSVGIALLLPKEFLIVLAAYFTMTLVYSVRLKRQVIVDVMLLAGLYTMRIIAGAAATNIVPSFWLLAFSMFIFLSLAMVKRYSELLITLQQSKQEAAGRGYLVDDLPVLMSIGVSAGMGAVLVLALYLNNPETNAMYPNKLWLWAVPPILLYWVSRMWMKTHRGQVDDDPVVFAARDWQSLAVLVVSACIFAAALIK